MSYRQLSSLLLGFLSLVWFVPSASAGRLNRMTETLGLTPAQQQKIRTLRYNFRRSTVMLKARLQVARIDLRYLIDQPRPDLQKVTQAVEKAGKLEIEMKKKRILMMVRMKLVLTPAQAMKWKKIQQQRRAKRGRRWGRRGRRWGRRGRRWGRRGRRWKGGQGGPPPRAGQPQPPAPPQPR